MIDINELRRLALDGDLAAMQEIILRLEAAEKERDAYKSAYADWTAKTEWLQDEINNGTISPKYLGWHRADVITDLLEVAKSEFALSMRNIDELRSSMEFRTSLIGRTEAERDALRAKIEAMEKQEPAYWGPKHAIEGGSTTVIVGKFPVNPTDAPLYALPGAKGEEK